MANRSEYLKAWRSEDGQGTLSSRRAYRKFKGIPDLQPGLDERCEVCGLRDDRSSQLVPDHCHNTGNFRGWLCPSCNLAIGGMKDDPDRLHSAAAYLNRAR